MNSILPGAVLAGLAEGPFHLAIGLRDTGWHPGSWFRIPQAEEVFTARYWGDLAETAEQAGADLVTFDDSLDLQRRGRLDASLVAAWIGARTSAVGLVPTVTTTHTEPFHISKNLATLDHISNGRAGWLVEVSSTHQESELLGRGREDLELETLYAEAQEAVQVVRLLWDSWEDDAEIRDTATGRFVDREKLHYIDYEGTHFSVKGPSITPRPPQGQPLVTYQGNHPAQLNAAAENGDAVFVAPHDDAHARRLLAEARGAERDHGRSADPLLVFADLTVLIDATSAQAQQRWSALDDAAGQVPDLAAPAVIGTASQVAERIDVLAGLGFSGARLLPAEHAIDLARIAEELAPELRHGDSAPSAPGLRGRLGLGAAPNRHVTGHPSALAGGA